MHLDLEADRGAGRWAGVDRLGLVLLGTGTPRPLARRTAGVILLRVGAVLVHGLGALVGRLCTLLLRLGGVLGVALAGAVRVGFRAFVGLRVGRCRRFGALHRRAERLSQKRDAA